VGFGLPFAILLDSHSILEALKIVALVRSNNAESHTPGEDCSCLNEVNLFCSYPALLDTFPQNAFFLGILGFVKGQRFRFKVLRLRVGGEAIECKADIAFESCSREYKDCGDIENLI
jgi:hypothetical protein